MFKCENNIIDTNTSTGSNLVIKTKKNMKKETTFLNTDT